MIMRTTLLHARTLTHTYIHVQVCLSASIEFNSGGQGEEDKLAYICTTLGVRPNGISPTMLFELTSLQKP